MSLNVGVLHHFKANEGALKKEHLESPRTQLLVIERDHHQGVLRASPALGTLHPLFRLRKRWFLWIKR